MLLISFSLLFFFSTCDAYLLVQSLNTPGHKDDSNTYKEEALNLNLVNLHPFVQQSLSCLCLLLFA